MVTPSFDIELYAKNGDRLVEEVNWTMRRMRFTIKDSINIMACDTTVSRGGCNQSSCTYMMLH